MTAPVPLLPAPEERSTRYGQLRDRLLRDPDWGRAIRWLAPLVITAIAALLRLINVAHPHQLAFDETYYVKDAWSLWTLGYEGTWGENANDAFITLQQLPCVRAGRVHRASASRQVAHRAGHGDRRSRQQRGLATRDGTARHRPPFCWST